MSEDLERMEYLEFLAWLNLDHCARCGLAPKAKDSEWCERCRP